VLNPVTFTASKLVTGKLAALVRILGKAFYSYIAWLRLVYVNICIQKPCCFPKARRTQVVLLATYWCHQEAYPAVEDFGFEPLFSIKDNVHFQGFKLLLKETETAPSIPVAIKINNFFKHNDLDFYSLLLEIFFLTWYRRWDQHIMRSVHSFWMKITKGMFCISK